jgi:pyruvate kinase
MMNKKTKIVATLGPASSSTEELERMISEGVNICRINFSHGDHGKLAELIGQVREINGRLGTHVGILADLQGPKIRLGEVQDGEVMIHEGDELIMTNQPCVGTAKRVHITYQDFAKDVVVGDNVLIDDGKLVLSVKATDKLSEVTLVVKFGGPMRSKKGVNLPNTDVSMPSLTEKDLKDLDFALQKEVEWIGLSFVRSAADIIDLRERIRLVSSRARIVAKIEKPEALRELDLIIEETDAVMVARGDLGVEVPMEQVPVIQKLIVKKCLNAGKPVIIATQMMESMITNPSPTRAEVNDVANAVLDGADAVMLSGETSVGNHPYLVVRAMTSIITYIETYEDIYHRSLLPTRRKDRVIADAICHSAVTLAEETGTKAIITMTNSGYTAFRISSYRPKADVFVFTDNKMLLNTLALVWGVNGYYYDKYVSTDHTIADIRLRLKQNGHVREGDRMINVASMPITEKGQANMLKLTEV